MTLDLDELTCGWDCPSGELRARVVVGRDGQEVIQLRVDLGVMQMNLSGRPDGERWHGLPSAAEHIRHELRVADGRVSPEDWQELERELLQTNYRRMAFAGVAEDALRASDDAGAQRYLEHALADIEACLATLTLLAERPAGGERYPALQPALVFDRARLGAQLRIVTGQYEEAIELAESGADELETMLNNLGYGEEQCADDAGLRYLRGMSVQLRREYGITHTLSEQLAEAVEHEDFETAAQLRDELQRRQKDGRRTPGVPEA